jgi:parallel beta-helix repeat protein
LYSGNIEINKDNLTLKSTYGAEKTVIVGDGTGPVISIAEHFSAVIEGFTVKSINDPDVKGFRGGGIYCAPSSSPTIKDNVISENKAVFGGGIFCAHKSSPVIRNNIVSKNHAVRFGGGIFCYKASPKISNNTIVANQAGTAGGGIFCARDSSSVSNNIIWQNRSRSGGGISCDRSSCNIVNDTITENVAVHGGGIFFDGGAIRMSSNILWKNDDDLYAPLFTPATRPVHSNIGDGDFMGANGNISADPLFVDAENGDFRLSPGSPCIDAGDPEPLQNDSDGSTNDMGAFGGPDPHFGRSSGQ